MSMSLFPWIYFYLFICGSFLVLEGRKHRHGDVLHCSPHAYQTYDGSCHNLDHPTYGMAGSLFRRILPPRYDNDDGQTPRLTGVYGTPLPSPRAVSSVVHEEESHTSKLGTMMVVQWAQFLDHDLTYTPNTPNCSCCDQKFAIVDGQHPDVRLGGPCFPILIDKGDPYFSKSYSRCMEFRRSDSRYDAHHIRQQYNTVSSWIDASHIYGTTADVAWSLRSFKHGKLKVALVRGDEFLPPDENYYQGERKCFLMGKGDYCFKAGDARVNQYPGLSALHTIFLRYHNQICDRLKNIHHQWDDEKIYQEARRVVIAVVQRITYDQFLSQVLGPLAAKYELLPGVYHYDASIDPTLPNVFSTAAYRFGHSLIRSSLNIDGEIIETGDFFMRPKYVLESLPGIVRALIDESCQKADRYYSKGMTNRMFEDPHKPRSGYDIVSLNIQRGRDHGLPPYNDWRAHFGLERKTFETMRDSEKYRQVYKSVDDIDVYSGAINEKNVQGAMVGELYSKILAQQFRDIKFADRFWFENHRDVTSFKKKQIREILKVSLSKIICDTVPGFSKIQPNVFMPRGPDNDLMPCSAYESINFEKLWQ